MEEYTEFIALDEPSRKRPGGRQIDVSEIFYSCWPLADTSMYEKLGPPSHNSYHNSSDSMPE